jgi:hypothetical protein
MKIRNGVLQGVLNGKMVSCTLRPGVDIPRGLYKLLPAVQDPVFGTLILMAPLASRSKNATRTQLKIKSQGGARGTESSSLMFKVRDGVMFKVRDGVMFKVRDGVMFKVRDGVMFKVRDGINPEQVLVLSSRAVPGRNNVVVSLGFSSLVEGLQTSGGEIEVV